MADSLFLGSLLVHPGAIAAAAEPVHAIGVGILHSLSALPSANELLVVSDPQCTDKLRSTCLFVIEAIKASSGGVDDLSRALDLAATTYRLADSDALAGWGW
jgi:hypothetical protein